MTKVNVSKDISVETKNIWLNKNFLLLWAGTTFSNFTFVIFTFSLPILIYNMTHSPIAMSSMRAIEVIPNLVFGMFVGVLVDRLNKKKILILSTLVQLIAISILTFLIINSFIEIWSLYILGFIIFTSGFIFVNAYHTVIPILIPINQLTSANSIISLWNTIINISGPSIAGFIYLMVRHEYSLLITCTGLFVLLIFLSMLHIPGEKKDMKMQRNSLRVDIKEGWIQLKSIQILWKMTILILCLNIANGLTGAVLIFHALDNLNTSKVVLGIIISSSSVGAVFASLIAQKSKNWFKRGALFIYMLILSFIGQMMLFVSYNWFWLAIGMIIIGFATTLINIHYITIRQESTPNHLLGRVVGTSSMLMKLAVPISYLLGGIMASYIPIKFVFLFSAIIIATLTLHGYKNRLYNSM